MHNLSIQSEQLKKNKPIIKLLNLTLFTIGLLLDLIDEINILKKLSYIRFNKYDNLSI
jgi:hypothetical protein